MSNSDPTISIVTICRNAADTIESTIESVLSQAEEGVEYIVVDGVSTDKTVEIVKSFKGINKLVSEPDDGIADAFNKGISLANNDIVGLVNADDQLTPDAILFVREYFQLNPEVDVIHGDTLLYEGARFIKRLRPAGRWWYPWRLVLFNHPATFVRRSIYQQYGGFDPSFEIAMDVELFLRWLKRGVKVDYIPRPLTAIKIGGVSSNRAAQGFREFRDALILHGYPPLVANLQYLGKVILNTFLRKVRWLIPVI